jgi:hypothetical protein
VYRRLGPTLAFIATPNSAFADGVIQQQTRALRDVESDLDGERSPRHPLHSSRSACERSQTCKKDRLVGGVNTERKNRATAGSQRAPRLLTFARSSTSATNDRSGDV